LFLNSHFSDKGFSMIEFARTGLLAKDTLQFVIEDATELRLSYNFTSHEQASVQRGYVHINHDPIPSKVALYPAYPNPFNPVTTLRFDIPNSDISQKVLLLIFDINGRQVESLVNGSKLPGAYQIQWQADQFASGMYFAKLISGEIVKTQKIILLK